MVLFPPELVPFDTSDFFWIVIEGRFCCLLLAFLLNLSAESLATTDERTDTGYVAVLRGTDN